MSAHKLKACQVSEMRRHYLAGERVSVLAEWFGVSPPVVRYHTRDIRQVRSRFTFDYSKVAKLWAQGMTSAQIGARLGISRNTVNGAIGRLRAAGVPVERRRTAA